MSSAEGARGRCRPRSCCRWSRPACAPATAARRSSAPRPPGRSRRRPAAGPRGDRHVGAAAGGDRRDLGLGVELVGADAVGPHAGGVDDVVGADDELAAGLRVAHGDVRPVPLPVAPSSVTSQPVGADRAEALRLAQHGEHEPGVVGLAVVEEVAAGGTARRIAGSSATTSSPEMTRWRAGLQSTSCRRSRASARRALRRPRRRGVAITSYMFSPIPTSRSGRAPSNAGTHERQRPDQVRRQLDHQLALEQRLAHQAEVEVLQVAQAAVDELRRAAAGARGEVGLLDQRHAVAARGRVERHPGAGDPAADHQHVEVLGRPGPRGRARG